MFSGIIEGKGKIVSVRENGDVATYTIETNGILDDVSISDSVAVDGICLTVISRNGTHLEFEAVPETVKRTNLGTKQEGDAVNLERALTARDRIDGHFVQGHIDCTDTIVSAKALGESREITIEIPEGFEKLIVPKGSVAVDGISLTVAECDGNQFKVAVIPHTLELTTVDNWKAGDLVNIEFDIIGKYVMKSLENWKGTELL